MHLKLLFINEHLGNYIEQEKLKRIYFENISIKFLDKIDK